MPAPGNPQALNRYSYVLNNPLRYTDPTGMFSEDEIMGYLGVSTWDDVLAMFGEDGKLQGRWGWLGVLRSAEVGDWIQVLDGWNGGWFQGSVDDITIFAGVFVELDTRLFVQGRDNSLVGAEVVGLLGDAYYSAKLDSYGSRFGGHQAGASSKQWVLRPRPFSEVDWVGVGLDLASIVVDIPTLGAGGRVVNGVQLGRAAGRVGAALDVASIGYAGVHTGASVVQGDWASAGSGAIDVNLALLGTQVPIVFDVISLINTFAYFSP